MLVPILRTQSEIHSLLESITQDTANERWSDARIYEALNLALSVWQGRVMIPYIYTISGGWIAGTFEYSLPDYIDGPIQPQRKRFVYDWSYWAGINSEDDTWTDIEAFDVEPTATGGQTLRLHYYNYETDGRVIWWGHNGPVPAVATLPVLNAGIDSDDTSLTLTTTPTVGRSGFIKINAEWMQYSGLTEAASTLTLTNLVRGVNGTTAASHSGSDTVTWGIALDDAGLLRQLLDQARAHMMEFYLSNSSSREVGHYEKQMVFYQQRADVFWRRYISSRKTRVRLSRASIGTIEHGMGWL